jgi:hypothetical protein
MANSYLDPVLPAVAQIVSASFGSVISAGMTEQEKEAAIVAYADKLTRTLVTAFAESARAVAPKAAY